MLQNDVPRIGVRQLQLVVHRPMHEVTAITHARGRCTHVLISRKLESRHLLHAR